MPPMHTDEFTLTHRGFQRQLHNRKEVGIPGSSAGREEPGFLSVRSILSVLQSPVASTIFGWKFDIADRIMDIYTPLLTGYLK